MNRKSVIFIVLIVLSSVCAQSKDEDDTVNKRMSFWGTSSKPSAASSPVDLSVPSIPLVADLPILSSNYSSLPSIFTQDAKYQTNNDLLQILNLFTSKFSVDAIVNEFWHNKPTVETCVGCNILIKHMQSEYLGDEQGFKKFFFYVCELFKINGADGGEFCNGFTEIYASQLFYILENAKLNSEEVCASLLTECLDHFHWYKQPLFWEIKLTEQVSKIKQYMTPRSLKQEEQNSSTSDDETSKRSPPPPSVPATNYSANSYINYKEGEELFEGAKFLHLSDLHLDLLYSLHSTSYCGRILCCRKTEQQLGLATPPKLLAQPTIPPHHTRNPKLRFADPAGSYYANMYSENQTPIQNQQSPAGFWGSFGNCDLPLRTIKHMLRHLSDYMDQIDYVIWSGDSVSHNIWSTDKKQVIETNAILTRLIQRYLLTPRNAINAYQQPRKLVPVVGNHESDVVSM